MKKRFKTIGLMVASVAIFALLLLRFVGEEISTLLRSLSRYPESQMTPPWAIECATSCSAELLRVQARSV
tara:strand:- start:378 stop:587 length:210 start_codon:yes stop_codon:yes gene_type:complete